MLRGVFDVGGITSGAQTELLRGGPAFRRAPRRLADADVATDARRPLSLGVTLNHADEPSTGFAFDQLGTRVTARPSGRVELTLGPSLDRSEFTAPPNMAIEAFVPHDHVMPLAAAMVTQCGLGTLAKALAFGLPLVCIPILADQPGNAALVVVRGAGVRLSPNASPREIARAIMRILSEPRFREAAARLKSRIAGEDGALNAAIELEFLADRKGNPKSIERARDTL